MIILQVHYSGVGGWHIPFKDGGRLGEEVEIVLAGDETVSMVDGALEASTPLPAHLEEAKTKTAPK